MTTPDQTLLEIELALTEATWERDPTAPENTTAFRGTTGPGGWSFLIVAWDFDDQTGQDGTASRISAGTIVHLTPTLAKQAITLARRSCF